jgi:hypothetical protein
VPHYGPRPWSARNYFRTKAGSEIASR